MHRGSMILVAGTGSGVGKTSVTLALIRSLVRSGLSVRPFKVGPDYLDPTHLGLAAGRTCYNLDTWMCGDEYVASLVAEKTVDGSIAVIEGAMGLFDGVRPDSSEGSAAEVAGLLDAPVLLVCDARGQARSLAATVKGFAELEPGVRIAGVIANHCGSARHARLLSEALRAEGLPPLVGGIEKGAFPTLGGRHLGLVPAEASSEIEKTLETLAETFESRVSMESILNMLPSQSHCDRSAILVPPLKKGEKKTPQPVRLGIARDAAFHFYYPDNLEAFETEGFELVPFSLVADDVLPEGLDALYIGGGYPELAAEELSTNQSMRASVRSFCRSGRPVYAECGGLMYLCEGVVLSDGTRHAMAGVLPGLCRMKDRIAALGYAEVVLTESSLFGEAGTRLRGHAFHYSDFEGFPIDQHGWTSVYDVVSRRGGAPVKEGYQKGNVLISYVHLHLASHPFAIVHFRDTCLSGGAAVIGDGPDMLTSSCPVIEDVNISGPSPASLDDARRTEALMCRFLENPMSPDAVERRSFQVIEAEAPDHHFSPDEWIVVRRMIHASADLSLVGDIFFSPGALRAAAAALLEGAPIYVDANMIRAGLSMPRLKRVNSKYDEARVVCHVADPDIAQAARAAGLPRSIFAVRKARPLLDGGIAVFGNAPLALLELNRMIIEDALCPAFVVAMPVGFVHVVESKRELKGLGVPHVSVDGRRGGSPLAVSALHALCSIAEKESRRSK